MRRPNELLCVKAPGWRRVGVGQELAVDGIGDPPLETAQGFAAGLALALFAHQIGAAGMVAAGLGDGHGVQSPVQSAVVAAVQPMPLGRAGVGRLTCDSSEPVVTGGPRYAPLCDRPSVYLAAGGLSPITP